jgi:hypothetical protein
MSDALNFFGGYGFAGGSLTAEASQVSSNLRAVVFDDDEQLRISGHQARRIAAILDALVIPCLACGGDGANLKREPCGDCYERRMWMFSDEAWHR